MVGKESDESSEQQSPQGRTFVQRPTLKLRGVAPRARKMRIPQVKISRFPRMRGNQNRAFVHENERKRERERERGRSLRIPMHQMKKFGVETSRVVARGVSTSGV